MRRRDIEVADAEMNTAQTAERFRFEPMRGDYAGVFERGRAARARARETRAASRNLRDQCTIMHLYVALVHTETRRRVGSWLSAPSLRR